MNRALVLVVGLTGVGKTTTLELVADKRPDLVVLPNRRALTDQIIIPAVQDWRGEARKAVADRLERFSYTGAYRTRHPGGIVHALGKYLQQDGLPQGERLIFDNIRGVAETGAALKAFPEARFIGFDAPLRVRLERLLDRRDAFDGLSEAAPAGASRLRTSLNDIDGAEALFDLDEIASLTEHGYAEAAVIGAVNIIAEEQRHYDSAATRQVLEALAPERWLWLDTHRGSPRDMAAEIVAWL